MKCKKCLIAREKENKEWRKITADLMKTISAIKQGKQMTNNQFKKIIDVLEDVRGEITNNGIMWDNYLYKEGKKVEKICQNCGTEVIS